MDKIALLLAMVEAAGGEIDSSENPHSLLNYFCDDCGRDEDTFNQANDRGFLQTFHSSMFETSSSRLTPAGRDYLAASGVQRVACG